MADPHPARARRPAGRARIVATGVSVTVAVGGVVAIAARADPVDHGGWHLGAAAADRSPAPEPGPGPTGVDPGDSDRVVLPVRLSPGVS